MSVYYTTHDSTGQAVFSKSIPEQPHLIPFPHDPSGESGSRYIYTSHVPQPDLSTEADISQLSKDRIDGMPKGTIIPANGFGINILTMGPGKSPNHRTMTLDMIYLLEGEIELTLDSGEMKLLKPGDTVVQRGTKHQWNNVSPNGGNAKILGVSVAGKGETIDVGGKQLGTEWS